MFFAEKAKLEELWLNQDSQVEWRPPFQYWRTDNNKNKTIVSYVQEWIAACETHPTGVHAADEDGSWEEISQRIAAVDRFALRFNLHRAAQISNKLIHTLEIQGAGPFTFANCAIKHLTLRPEQISKIRLENCKIGNLSLTASCVATVEIIRCSVRRVYAPTPNQGSPFTGSVEVRESSFSSAFENAQAYRNLRHHLTTLHNHEAASVFHAAEMQAEVKRQSSVDRLAGFVYRALSNYGGSSARPLILFLIFVLSNFAFLFLSDGAVAIGEAHEAEGWRFELYGFDDKARFLRSIVFATSQCFNPLGVFGTRLLLSGRTPSIALISAVLGIASTLSLTLFILAIRRRFRLDRRG